MSRSFLRGVRAIPLLLLLLLQTSLASAAGTRWALLVGIDQYRDRKISTLQCGVADVKAVAQTLNR